MNKRKIDKRESMIVPHPFWDEIKPKKGTKIPGTDLDIERILVTNGKYDKFVGEIYGLPKQD